MLMCWCKIFIVDLYKAQNGKSNLPSLTNVIEYILCDVPHIIDTDILKATVSVLVKVRD